MSVTWWLAPHTLRQAGRGGVLPQWDGEGHIGPHGAVFYSGGRDLLQGGETSWITRWQGGGLVAQ